MMKLQDRSATTRWSLVEGAAQGCGDRRQVFAERYLPVVSAYLGARWRSSRLIRDLDDALQDVFFECFKPGGALERATRRRPGGFRAYLYGVARNVAGRWEEGARKQRVDPWPSSEDCDALPREDDLRLVFDRAWAEAVVQQAVERHAAWARYRDDDARRRVELLELRFQEGLPIRTIAHRWNEEPSRVHYEYARARDELKAALREIVAAEGRRSEEEVDTECRRMLGLLARRDSA